MSLIIVTEKFPNPGLIELLISTDNIKKPFEIILIVSNKQKDNKTNDYLTNLLQTIQQLTSFTIIRLDSDIGLASSRNIGAMLAKSNNLIFSDDDIVLIEDISPLIKHLEKNHYQSIQPLILKKSNQNVIDSAGDDIIRLRGIYHAVIRGAGKNLNNYNKQLITQQLPSLRGACMAVRKDALLAIGGFDNSFFFNFDDVDLGWRMTIAGYKNAFTPTVKVLHQGGKTTNPRVKNKNSENLFLVNHHAMQLKITSYTSWPFILARYICLALRLKCQNFVKTKKPLEMIKETLIMERMLLERIKDIQEHRRILDKKFQRSGKKCFNAMLKSD